MVTIPVEGRWSLKALSDDDVRAALEFLRLDPLINVYLISRVLEERYPAATQLVQIQLNRKTVLVASLATNIVLASAPGMQREITEVAIAMICDRIVSRAMPVRAIISPAVLVEMLWTRLRMRIDPPTVVRMSQPIYALQGRSDYPNLNQTRYSTIRDLELLVPACAAMHREEVGIDPLERDALGYRERVRELIEKKRSFVRVEGGRIMAKCELSAVTPEAVQVMGVWTAPEARRRGFARSMMREVCGHLCRDGKAITLFVNDFNYGAIRLYEMLGFQQIGLNRAMIW